MGQDGAETAIEEPSFKDGTVAFSATRERNGQKRTTKYNGKLEGDTIKGKVELPGFGGGEATTMDWNATRAK